MNSLGTNAFSQQTMLREGKYGFADDEVIQYANVNQGQGFFKFCCNHAIGLTGIADPRRVVMRCQTALKIFQQRASNSFQLTYRVIGFPPPFSGV